MEKEAISIFKQAILVLLIVLSPAACRYENPYKLELSCDGMYMTLRYQFEKPFKGYIFTDGYRFDPDCSLRAPPLSTIRNVTFLIDLSSCGTRIQFVPNGRSIIENVVRIQQHNILRTSNDIVEPISCSVLGLEYSCRRFVNFDKPEITPPKINSQLEIKSGQKALGIKLASELQLFNKPLIAFSIPNKGRINDINVKNCIIHEKMVLDDDSFFYQITHPSGCQNTSSDVMSAFSVVNNTESGHLVAYAELKPFKMTSEHGLYVSCGAQLCKRTCKRKCPRKFESDVVHTIATHSISKRSIGSNSDQHSLKESDVRNRLLKSTIKALSQKLIRQIRSQNDTILGKRVLSIEQKEESKIPVESSNSGIPVYSFADSDEEFSTTSSRDYDVTLLNVNEDLDDIEQLEEDYKGFRTTIATLPEIISKPIQKQYDDQHRALKSSIKILTEKFKGLSGKQKQALEKTKVGAIKKGKVAESEEIVDAVKKDESTDLKESVDSPTSTLALIDSDTESNDYELTLNTFVKPSDMTQFEVTNFDKATDITTPPANSPRDLKEVGTDGFTAISESTENMMPLNESTGKDFSINLNLNKSTEFDYKHPLYGSCVPKLTFLVVSIVLGFIIFTLLLICCGMVLYIRKEKKRHLIDNFLLYNFY